MPSPWDLTGADDIKTVQSLAAKGMTEKAICKATGLSPKRVREILAMRRPK